jgi:hypothetical protein
LRIQREVAHFIVAHDVLIHHSDMDVTLHH